MLRLLFTYAEALDGGDQSKTAEYRDEIFTGKLRLQRLRNLSSKTKQRYKDLVWTNDHYAIVSEGWYDTRNTKSYLLDLSSGESKVFDDRNYQDVYSDPGHFNTTKTNTEDL